MLFNSAAFIFVFLPTTLIATHLAIWQWGRFAGVMCLILASTFFYAWWDVRGITLINLSIALNFICAVLLHLKKERPIRLAVVWFGIACNLGALAYFKYTDFLLSNLGLPVIQITLPLAISFFSFQQIAFLVDAYHHKIVSVRLRDYAVSVLFFPHLIAGPLIHYNRIMDQFERSFSVSANSVLMGLPVFFVGLTKKAVIADPIATIVTPLFAKAQTGALEPVSAWVAALGYTAQLYFDFSGYSDMAIGLGLMFSITLPINFNDPYRSTSIIEFWRRWHITLSEFLRTYLYIPLGGNKGNSLRRYSNLLAVMLLGGLWHGAGWTYVLWGALHGCYLIINHLWRSISSKAPRIAHRLVSILSWPLTFFAVVVAWVFFKAPDFSTALNVLKGMAWQTEASIPGEIAYLFSLDRSEYFGIKLTGAGMPYGDFMVCATMLVIAYIMIFFPANLRPALLPSGDTVARPWARFGLVVGVMVWLSLFSVVGSAPSEFIYFQF